MFSSPFWSPYLPLMPCFYKYGTVPHQPLSPCCLHILICLSPLIPLFTGSPGYLSPAYLQSKTPTSHSSSWFSQFACFQEKCQIYGESFSSIYTLMLLHLHIEPHCIPIPFILNSAHVFILKLSSDKGNLLCLFKLLFQFCPSCFQHKYFSLTWRVFQLLLD